MNKTKDKPKCSHCLKGLGFLVLTLDDLDAAPESQHVKCNGCGYEWNPHAAEPAPSDAERVLREALDNYGEHHPSCRKGDHHSGDNITEPAREWSCTCGLDDLLRAPQRPPLERAVAAFLSDDEGCVVVHPGTDDDNTRLDVPTETWDEFCEVAGRVLIRIPAPPEVKP